MLKITDSLAPDTVTVKELAQVCRPHLMYHFAATVGLYTNQDDPNEQLLMLANVIRDYNYQSAITNFRDWAKDTNSFYNADKTAEYLRELFMAVESATDPLCPLYHLWSKLDGHGELGLDAYYRDLYIMMEDGEFDSIINSYNQAMDNTTKAVDISIAEKQSINRAKH